MSAATPAAPLAPINLRLRLAVSALFLSWALAAVFILLGWSVSRNERTETSSATHVSELADRA